MISKTRILTALKSKTTFFFLLASLIYLFWFLLYELYIKPSTLLDEKIITNIVFTTKNLLEFFSYTVHYSIENLNYQAISVNEAMPVLIGGPCDGVSIMAIFFIFVAAYPGSQLHKLWFIPIGILLIHFINIIRVASLTLICLYTPEYLEFNHNYTFTLIVYGFVFLLWMTWVNKFSRK